MLVWCLVRNPIETFHAHQYEAPFDQYRMFDRGFTLLNDPALIRGVFVENAAKLEFEFVRQAMLRPALRDGLLTSQGDVWKATRRALAPVFSPRHIEGFAASMQRTAEAFSARMAPGDGVPVAPLMTRLAYEILSDTLFSGEISADTGPVLRDVARFLDALGQPDPMDLFRAPAWVPRITRLRAAGAIGRLRALVASLAESRRRRMAAGEAVPDDFLTLLLQAGERESALGPEEIVDNILTFIGAGHETTARAMAWMLYLVASDARVRERLEAEIDAFDNAATPPQRWLDSLPFTRATIEEAMRLYPPAAFITRRATADIAVNGVVIAAGTTALLSVWLLHRHRTLWSNPDAFDPGRFMPGEREKIDRFQYLPFGLGPRVCIGASFALQEAVIMAVTLLKRFRFDYAGKEQPWPLMRITVQPHNGLPMRVTRR